MFLIKLRRQLFLQAESRIVSAKLTHNLRLVFALFLLLKKTAKRDDSFLHSFVYYTYVCWFIILLHQSLTIGNRNGIFLQIVPQQWVSGDKWLSIDFKLFLLPFFISSPMHHRSLVHDVAICSSKNHAQFKVEDTLSLIRDDHVSVDLSIWLWLWQMAKITDLTLGRKLLLYSALTKICISTSLTVSGVFLY